MVGRPPWALQEIIMALKDIQLAQISPSNRAEGKFTVKVYSDDGKQQATFNVTGEGAALALRNALRDHADCLSSVADYRR